MTMNRSDALDAAREELHARAALQGGAFRRADLPGWGLDEATLRALIRRRLAIRLRHGIYADVAVLDAARADETRMHMLDLSAAMLSLDYPASITPPMPSASQQRCCTDCPCSIGCRAASRW
jgi:hypothetical protein